MRQVFLVRHAHHDRLGRILCGRMPGVSLSEDGRQQAQVLAARLSTLGTARVLSSPRCRALETAQPVAQQLGLNIETSAELDEIDFGEWTGLRLDNLDLDTRWATWNTARTRSRPPGGESMTEAQMRIVGLLERLAAEEGAPAILVSHADVIRAAALHLLGLGLDAYDRIVVDPASSSEISVWPGGGRVVSLNERAAP